MKEIKILLICSAGTSTSLLVDKMHKQAAKDNKDYKINALGQTVARQHVENYDVILLAPGLKYNFKQFVIEFPNKALGFIEPRVYAISDAKAVLSQAEKLYQEKYQK